MVSSNFYSKVEELTLETCRENDGPVIFDIFSSYVF